ncbi:MAG: glutamate-5-semialdehyde dehydrogenase [Candidatus Latescibacteria bacterium]|nr:glutamate-5-semialdehyde dehydrogenase [Candidatus Latescibacterota bacterium]
MSQDILRRAQDARRASRALAVLPRTQRDAALEAIARAMEEHRDRLLEANQADLAAARGQLSEPLYDRLQLGRKFDKTVAMVRSVASQPDPLGQTQSAMEIAQGLEVFRVSVPIGVIGVVFESRPDALVQIATLCLKSGNAVLLKGGREAAHTNRALGDLIAAASAQVEGIPEGWITLLESRQDVQELLAMDQYVDLLVPRGGNELVQHIMHNTRIPVMGHADGICHVYVDRAADLDKAVRLTVDSKVQDVSVCNAAETLLVHRAIAGEFLARAVPALLAAKVQLRGDEAARQLSGANGQMQAASEEDWASEYLDYILAVKVVDGLDEAIDHVNRYSSHHTDSIITEDKEAGRHFLQAVDSSSVMRNASTRFADGFIYGLGAEVGISTNRLHSRGPVGLEGLTIYKYIIEGDDHAVDDFDGTKTHDYTHRPLEANWLAS